MYIRLQRLPLGNVPSRRNARPDGFDCTWTSVRATSTRHLDREGIRPESFLPSSLDQGRFLGI